MTRPKAADAATALKITAQDLQKIGVVDEIIEEPLGGAHRDYQFTAKKIKESLIKHIKELSKHTPDEIARDRYDKFRKMGTFEDKPSGKKDVKAKKEKK